MFGAWAWFWQQADGFWEYLLAILQGIFWPAFMVYEAFQALGADLPADAGRRGLQLRAPAPALQGLLDQRDLAHLGGQAGALLAQRDQRLLDRLGRHPAREVAPGAGVGGSGPPAARRRRAAPPAAPG